MRCRDKMTNIKTETRQFLTLFNLVTSQGQKQESVYEFEGIRAWHDFDGYTCWLAYKDVTITILFHSKFQVEFEKEETFNNFSKKAARLLALA